jgi:hypothetical protein
MTLPVTVIFPIYECADRLSRHLESIQEWLELVEEVIVVDSGSLDGSADLARRKIVHPKVRHEVVPPGLYAAWNHGIRLAGSEFCYISTVGDSIKREGLEHLVSTAQQLNVDVVISPPRCITEEGEPADFRVFPVHSIVSGSGLGESLRMEPWLSYLMATGFSIESFLGSSASNLYRTDCLKREPFPTDFGKAGDSAWFRSNSLRFKFAVTPRVCADFLLHQDHATRPHGEISELLGRLTSLSDVALREWSESEVFEKTTTLRILQSWREVAGTSPEKILDAVRHLEGVAATAEQQRKYIEELKDHLDKRAAIIQELTVECERLRSIPLAPSSNGGFFASLRKKLHLP